jgi:NhaA family Na+:H+ antiporter
VIAFFYTDDLSFAWLAIALVVLAVMLVGRKAGIRSVVFYLPLAIIVWFGFLESGVHATIAGVILGLSVPARAYYSDADFRRRAGWILERWDRDEASPSAHARLDEDALELAAIARESVSPLERWERTLHPWSAFVIVPLFALANAGVRFVGIDVVAAVFNPVALGVSVGLVIGKPVGVVAATFLGLKLKIGQLPKHVTLKQIIGVDCSQASGSPCRCSSPNSRSDPAPMPISSPTRRRSVSSSVHTSPVSSATPTCT